MERPATAQRTADVHGHEADQLSFKVTFGGQGQWSPLTFQDLPPASTPVPEFKYPLNKSGPLSLGEDHQSKDSKRAKRWCHCDPESHTERSTELRLKDPRSLHRGERDSLVLSRQKKGLGA